MEYINLSDTFAFFSHQHWLMQDKSQTETITTDMGKVEAATSAELVCETPPKKGKGLTHNPRQTLYVHAPFSGQNTCGACAVRGAADQVGRDDAKGERNERQSRKDEFQKNGLRKVSLVPCSPSTQQHGSIVRLGQGNVAQSVGSATHVSIRARSWVYAAHMKSWRDFLMCWRWLLRHLFNTESVWFQTALVFCTCSECSDKDAEE